MRETFRRLVLLMFVVILAIASTSYVQIIIKPLSVNSQTQADSSSEWPIFGQNLRHTRYSVSKAPQANDLLWNFTSSGLIVASSPSVSDGMVFICSTEEVYALNKTTGSIVWICPINSWSSPTVVDGMVFVGSNDAHIHALNETSGEEIWNFTTPDAVICSPSVADGMVFAGSLNDNYFYALNETTGEIVWSSFTINSIGFSCPAVADGMVFPVVFDVGTEILENGTQLPHYPGVIALNETTGERIWNFTTGDETEASPAVADGMVFITSYDNKIYALNETTGDVVWTYRTGNPIFSSPAIACGAVYVGSMDTAMYALNETNGDLIWNVTTGDKILSSAAVAEGTIFFGSRDGNLYALNATTGIRIWNFTVTGGIDSSPAIADGVVFVGTRDHQVYAFGSITGDINGDRVVDIFDAIILAGAFNSKPGSTNWIAKADVNGDGMVDIYDAILFANNFGSIAG